MQANVRTNSNTGKSDHPRAVITPTRGDMIELLAQVTAFYYRTDLTAAEKIRGLVSPMNTFREWIDLADLEISPSGDGASACLPEPAPSRRPGCSEELMSAAVEALVELEEDFRATLMEEHDYAPSTVAVIRRLRRAIIREATGIEVPA